MSRLPRIFDGQVTNCRLLWRARKVHNSRSAINAPSRFQRIWETFLKCLEIWARTFFFDLWFGFLRQPEFQELGSRRRGSEGEGLFWRMSWNRGRKLIVEFFLSAKLEKNHSNFTSKTVDLISPIHSAPFFKKKRRQIGAIGYNVRGESPSKLFLHWVELVRWLPFSFHKVRIHPLYFLVPK